MRRIMVIVGLSIMACGHGCQLIHDGTRNLIVESAAEYTLECGEFKRNQTLAEQAWHQVQQGGDHQISSADYAIGFKQGFIDYLNAGGNGEAPPVPPRYYWGLRYETPQGYRSIQDWYAGFAHGSAAAHDSGYRQFVVIPSPALNGHGGKESAPTHQQGTSQPESIPKMPQEVPPAQRPEEVQPPKPA